MTYDVVGNNFSLQRCRRRHRRQRRRRRSCSCAVFIQVFTHFPLPQRPFTVHPHWAMLPCWLYVLGHFFFWYEEVYTFFFLLLRVTNALFLKSDIRTPMAGVQRTYTTTRRLIVSSTVRQTPRMFIKLNLNFNIFVLNSTPPLFSNMTFRWISRPVTSSMVLVKIKKRKYLYDFVKYLAF